MPEKKNIARVRATKDGGFYRAGRHWPKGWTVVAEGELSEDQLRAIVEEPMLAIEWLRGTPAPKDEPKDEPKKGGKSKGPSKDESKKSDEPKASKDQEEGKG